MFINHLAQFSVGQSLHFRIKLIWPLSLRKREVDVSVLSDGEVINFLRNNLLFLTTMSLGPSISGCHRVGAL